MIELTRRHFFSRGATGIGVAALGSLLEADEGGLPGLPHFAAKAKRLIYLFQHGAPSQLDLFDHKPALASQRGKELPDSIRKGQRLTGMTAYQASFPSAPSIFKFKQHGAGGVWLSELLPHTARMADRLCVVRSMHTEGVAHGPATLFLHCGSTNFIRPSMGSWVLYGLGSENQNLPGFVAMCPGGYPIVATQNWRAAFLPGAYQGTYIDSQHSDVQKLIENIRNNGMTAAEQRKQLDLVKKLNEMHRETRPADPQLDARIETFELAYRMQSEAAEAFDVTREPLKVRERYGPGTHARQLLITRRLIERGVRFVQVWSGAGQPWDNHDGLEAAHRNLAKDWDRPIAAFLDDLKGRGLFDETLVMWGGEFGRTPVAELPALSGRDHNHYGFSMWLAGGGVKGGQVIGATDEFGFAAVEDKVHVHDLHATILHLLGFDHEKLTYRMAGRDFRLTDVHGRVVKQVVG